MRPLLLFLALVTSTFAAPHLEWDANAPTDEVTGYNVYLGSTLVGTTAANVTMYTLPFPLPAGRLTYTVTALNARGESLPSDPAVIPANLPGKPAKPRVALGAGG